TFSSFFHFDSCGLFLVTPLCTLFTLFLVLFLVLCVPFLCTTISCCTLLYFSLFCNNTLAPFACRMMQSNSQYSPAPAIAVSGSIFFEVTLCLPLLLTF